VPSRHRTARVGSVAALRPRAEPCAQRRPRPREAAGRVDFHRGGERRTCQNGVRRGARMPRRWP